MLSNAFFMTRTFPKAAIGFAVIATAIPWGLSGEAVFALPLTAMMLVFVFSSLRQAVLEPWFAFLAGLAVDVLTAGPFGFWALVFLLAHCSGRNIGPYAAGLGPLGLWLAFGVSSLAIGGLGWAIASLYFLRFLDPFPMALGLGAVAAMFPFACWTLERLVRLGQPGSTFSYRD